MARGGRQGKASEQSERSYGPPVPHGATLSSPTRRSEAYASWTEGRSDLDREGDHARPLTTGSEGLLYDRRHPPVYEPLVPPRGSDSAIPHRATYQPGSHYTQDRTLHGLHPSVPFAFGQSTSTTAWSSEHPASYDSRLHRRGGSLTLNRPNPAPSASHFQHFSDRRHTTYPIPSPATNVGAGSQRPPQRPPSAVPSRSQPNMSLPTEESSASGTGKTQAVFVNKLYTMLEDPAIQRAGLLRWSDDGMGFICPDPQEFAR